MIKGSLKKFISGKFVLRLSSPPAIVVYFCMSFTKHWLFEYRLITPINVSHHFLSGDGPLLINFRNDDYPTEWIQANAMSDIDI